jgi:hypothetical protein
MRDFVARAREAREGLRTYLRELDAIRRPQDKGRARALDDLKLGYRNVLRSYELAIECYRSSDADQALLEHSDKLHADGLALAEEAQRKLRAHSGLPTR